MTNCSIIGEGDCFFVADILCGDSWSDSNGCQGSSNPGDGKPGEQINCKLSNPTSMFSLPLIARNLSHLRALQFCQWTGQIFNCKKIGRAPMVIHSKSYFFSVLPAHSPPTLIFRALLQRQSHLSKEDRGAFYVRIANVLDTFHTKGMTQKKGGHGWFLLVWGIYCILSHNLTQHAGSYWGAAWTKFLG